MNTTEYYSALANDPAFRLQNATRNTPPPEEAGTGLLWSSASPDYGYYSPGGGAGWQELSEANLSDPTIAKAVANKALTGSGVDAAYWNKMGGLIPEGVGLGPNETGSLMEGTGSMHTVAPEVLDRMWRTAGITPTPPQP